MIKKKKREVRRTEVLVEDMEEEEEDEEAEEDKEEKKEKKEVEERKGSMALPPAGDWRDRLVSIQIIQIECSLCIGGRGRDG